MLNKQMPHFHHVFHIDFHHLRFDWHPFNYIASLYPFLQQLAPPAVYADQPASNNGSAFKCALICTADFQKVTLNLCYIWMET